MLSSSIVTSTSISVNPREEATKRRGDGATKGTQCAPHFPSSLRRSVASSLLLISLTRNRKFIRRRSTCDRQRLAAARRDLHLPGLHPAGRVEGDPVRA